MLDQLPRHTGHIRGLPWEDVDVLPKEADEHIFLFVAEVGPDPSSLGLVTGDEATSFTSLDLVDFWAASVVGISRSSREICYEVVRQSYMRMDMSVASVSVKLSFS